jgi:hypothetical protein
MRATLLTAFACVATINIAEVSAQAPQWRLRENLRIGSVNQANYSLGQVRSIAVDRQGNIFVTQPQSYEVCVFSPAGRYVRTMGKEGSGPGELRYVGQIGFRGDTLWVSDLVQSRITMFSPTGSVENTFTITGPMVEGLSIGPTRPIAMASDGSVVGEVVVQEGSQILTTPLVRMDRSGELINTFGAQQRTPRWDIREEKDGRSTGVITSSPVRDGGLWRLAPDNGGVVMVHRPAPTSGAQSSFRVQRFSADGTAVLDVSIPYTPREIPAGTRDSLSVSLGDGVPKSVNDEYVRRIRSIRYDVPVTSALVGRDGTIWLRREALGLRNVQWLILDPQGRQIGQITTPVGLTILEAERGQVWGVITDELEVPYVVRYTVAS